MSFGLHPLIVRIVASDNCALSEALQGRYLQWRSAAGAGRSPCDHVAAVSMRGSGRFCLN